MSACRSSLVDRACQTAPIASRSGSLLARSLSSSANCSRNQVWSFRIRSMMSATMPPRSGSLRTGNRTASLAAHTGSVTSLAAPRLTQYTSGGGCACKVPPGELERVLSGLPLSVGDDLLVGVDNGDDAAVVRIEGGRAIVLTTDFFTPVV